MGTPVELIKPLRRTRPASSTPFTNCSPPSIRKPPDHACPVSQHRQIHPGHHAPGRRRRRRRPAHLASSCWMFFLKIFDDQDQELEADRRTTTARRSRSSSAGAPGPPTPRASPATRLLAFVNDELFPTLKELDRRPARTRPPARRPRRLRGRLQLHEVRPVDAAGDQQDQQASTSTTWPSASTSATSTSRS